jgi:hypothetical protein
MPFKILSLHYDDANGGLDTYIRCRSWPGSGCIAAKLASGIRTPADEDRAG